MHSLDTYLGLAERRNTQKSYAASIKHFEQEWRGLLPATAESVAQYLVAYAGALAMNTLKLRLAALSHWHQEHGFTDPTKDRLVSQVLKGIRVAHTALEKKAKPVELDQLQQVCDWLDQDVLADPAARLPNLRDKAMLLMGFWRGFRADELTRLTIEHIEVEPGIGLKIFLPWSKGDRDNLGREYRCPALSRLCPVTAYEAWLNAAQITQGPVFRKIDRWGNLGATAIQAGSIIPWLRRLFGLAGVAGADQYSSHSLRRGFASWAHASGWDLKELMEYVGWKDVGSAMRYMDTSIGTLQARFEKGMPSAPKGATQEAAPVSVRQPRSPRGKAGLRVIK
ncbi:MAG: site-specific integrase [Rhodocyclaceae bacterium]|nr:site-specific integrase [Rhodocyclaceae bacterium]